MHVADPTADMSLQRLITGATKLGLTLLPQQLDQFQRYFAELEQWNRRVNLTSVTEWEEVQTRHFLDSLALSVVLPPRSSRPCRALDVGSGAGLPGLPLKIAFPEIEMTLLEAAAKKTAFLRHVTDKLGLSDVHVCTDRAETLAHDPAHRESYDIVVSRAVAGLSVLAEYCLGFCRAGGLAVAQKGPGVEVETSEALTAIDRMGGRLLAVRESPVRGPDGAGTLVLLEKVRSTPGNLPRRPGIPGKRPL